MERPKSTLFSRQAEQYRLDVYHVGDLIHASAHSEHAGSFILPSRFGSYEDAEKLAQDLVRRVEDGDDLENLPGAVRLIRENQTAPAADFVVELLATTAQ
jgi:hypothetical protein